MASIIHSFKLLADPTRLRILRLLRMEELSVAELQEILAMGQSRISTQLSQLKKEGLVADRRSGKKMIYQLVPPTAEEKGALDKLFDLVELAAAEIPEANLDREALQLTLKKRSDHARAYFDQLAGKFGRSYVPGRSWKGLAESLLKLMPPQVIADLGAGEGTFSQLLARNAKQVIAIDNSEKMVEFGAKLALEHGFENLEYRLGDLQSPPIDPGSVDLAFFSQSLHHAEKPAEAIRSAHEIIRPGGSIVVLDLLKHDFEEARELYADVWLGFAEVDIYGFLDGAGFNEIDIAIVDREDQPPHFQTLMAIARK
ncbi:MAG: ubiquinone/menaquinone biosynthesis C-methylase UbiE [Verrucomicrobiales bacterium]|jgi:ubiquinone/menaquinone biosynthesis C-methylase UbiE/DNA-binding transcriptional ArsR family regulator